MPVDDDPPADVQSQTRSRSDGLRREERLEHTTAYVRRDPGSGVDDLHERAGATRLLHMHGELRSALCALCGTRTESPDVLPPEAECPNCGGPALRPDIVFFGEMPYEMDRIDVALARADLFVSIGTSGAVYPAAGFVQTARHHGAATLELNLEPSAGSVYFAESRMGAASVLVPAWVREVLANA